MNIINVTVRGKMARAEERARVVCGNSDYAVRFDFDEEWEAYDLKTARFVTEGGSYTDVQFEGSDCTVPILANTRTLQVGVYAGNLRTTTAALIHALPCVTDPDGTPADPAPEVYSQLMERFNAMEAPAAVLYTEQELTDEQKEQARKNIDVATPDWNQNDETAADYITNRPFYRKKTYHYTWDGTRNQTEDVAWAWPSSSNYNCLHFISSETPPMTGRLKWATSRDSDSGEWIDINEGDNPARTTEYGWMKPSPATSLASGIVVVTTPNKVLTRKGIYFGGLYNPNYHTDYNYGYCAEFESGGGCQTIAPDYLPMEIQADWNQNDESALSYIKNRPFYEKSQEQDIFVGTVSAMATYTLNYPLIAGDTYECRVHGESLSVICQEFNGMLQLLFGSLGMLGVQDPQNNPLIATYMGPSGSSAGLTITHKATEVKKLDAKYLPEKFLINLTCDDDGNPQSDKTFEEIQAAYNAGQTIVLRLEDEEIDFALTYATLGSGFVFNVSDIGFDQWVWIRSDGVEISPQNFLPVASDNEPLPSGTPSAGSDAAYARADHVHPKETVIVSIQKNSDEKYSFVTGTYADIKAAEASGYAIFLRVETGNAFGNKYYTYVHYSTIVLPGDSRQFQFRKLGCDNAPMIRVVGETQIEEDTVDPFDEIILHSSTEGSIKRFALKVDDTGAVTATEMTD